MKNTLLASLTALTLLAGCQSGGGGGTAGTVPFEVAAADLRKADSLHQKALKSGQILAPSENRAATAYLDRVVARVATQRPPGSVPLRGFIVKDDDVNAFTTGTGYLYFNRGLLAALENEAQLAMIVGHEAAHVDAGHLAQGNTDAATVDLLTEIGSAVLESSGYGSGIAGTVGALGVGLAGRRASAYFSQNHELEADGIGLNYAMGAGYDGVQAGSAFRVLSRENGTQGRIAEFFASHPNSAGRLRTISARAAGSGQTGGYVGADAYREMLASFDLTRPR